MRSAAENKPAHIVKGNIFDALGFSASEASALKIKAEILSAILEHVRAKGYTQAELVDILDEYQIAMASLRSDWAHAVTAVAKARIAVMHLHVIAMFLASLRG